MARYDHDAFMMHALIWAAHADETPSNDFIEDEVEITPIEAAEAFILAHRPENEIQMIIQLEIICDDLDEGHRCDGLDVKAIRNIQRLLFESSTATEEGWIRFASMRANSSAGSQGPFLDTDRQVAH